VTSDKQVVRALCEWTEPTDLELISSIQSLDEPGKAEDGALRRQKDR
jgi:hypothetical protein